MSHPAPERRWLLPLLAVAALFAFLGSRGLNEPDEGRYAEIGREMTATGDWLVPHLNGFEHFQKPPLLYWTTAASIHLFGANEWAARLPSALAALGTVLLTAWIGQTLFGRREGFLAGLILLSSAGFFILGRLLTPDMSMTFWITAAIACYLEYAYRRQGRLWAWLFFAAVGLGFLTKGPMALVVPLSAAIAAQRAARSDDAPRLPWARGIILSIAIGLSWFIALSIWRHDLFDYFWRYELLQRFTSSAHGRSKPFWFFVPVIIVALLPWAFLLPTFIRTVWRGWRRRPLSMTEWLLIGWTILPFLILSLSGSKLPTYILPLLPALALGLARYVTRLDRPALWAPRLAYAALVVWLCGAAAVPFLNDRFGQQASVRDLIRPLANDPATAQARVYSVDVRAHGVEFYLRHPVSATRETSDIVLKPSPEQQQRLLSTEKFDAASITPGPADAPAYAVVRRSRATKGFPAQSWSEVGRAGDFVLLKSITQNLAALPKAE